MTDMETDIRDIKQQVMEISKKIDELVYEKEISSLMKLSDKSLSEFFEVEENLRFSEPQKSKIFEDEPDIYKLKDLKVRYK